MGSIVLKNVLTPEGERDITADVVPFSRRNDAHVDFAYAYADMMGRMPSRFGNLTDVSRGYVELFMVHKEDDAKNSESDYSCVLSDVRACRTLFHQEDAQKSFHGFFANA